MRGSVRKRRDPRRGDAGHLLEGRGLDMDLDGTGHRHRLLRPPCPPGEPLSLASLPHALLCSATSGGGGAAGPFAHEEDRPQAVPRPAQLHARRPPLCRLPQGASTLSVPTPTHTSRTRRAPCSRGRVRDDAPGQTEFTNGAGSTSERSSATTPSPTSGRVTQIRCIPPAPAHPEPRAHLLGWQARSGFPANSVIPSNT